MGVLQKTQTLNKNLIMDIIEERKGYKMTYKELLYLLYFQRYECFRTENHKKWLNSVGRCVLMVLTYLNTLGTHGASKKMILFSLLTLNLLRAMRQLSSVLGNLRVRYAPLKWRSNVYSGNALYVI